MREPFVELSPVDRRPSVLVGHPCRAFINHLHRLPERAFFQLRALRGGVAGEHGVARVGIRQRRVQPPADVHREEHRGEAVGVVVPAARQRLVLEINYISLVVIFIW